VPEQQVILITGCSSGIGRATAGEAASRGHAVFASSRDPQSLEGLKGDKGIRTLPLDVADPANIRGAVSEVLAQAGRLDALVNNAGYGQMGAVEDLSAEEWRRQFEVNFFGAIELVRAVLPAMRGAGRGTIVNVSSIAGKLAFPFAAAYCASKHALEAASDALRVEVSPFGVRVVLIEPGPIRTRFTERARESTERIRRSAGPYNTFYPAAERAMERNLQVGSLPPEAVARVILGAIESDNPRPRYRLTGMARAFVPLRPLLPDRLLDRLLKKILRLPNRV
jgi:NAD(P)-dependent dehydrogenase (short-subunit alcohol dehydrogenase family)